MQISVNIPNEWIELIDKTAANECHRSRATIIRQVLKKHFIDSLKQQEAQTVTAQTQAVIQNQNAQE